MVRINSIQFIMAQELNPPELLLVIKTLKQKKRDLSERVFNKIEKKEEREKRNWVLLKNNLNT